MKLHRMRDIKIPIAMSLLLFFVTSSGSWADFSWSAETDPKYPGSWFMTLNAGVRDAGGCAWTNPDGTMGGDPPHTEKEKAELAFFFKVQAQIETILKARGFTVACSAVPYKYSYRFINSTMPNDMKELVQTAVDRATAIPDSCSWSDDEIPGDSEHWALNLNSSVRDVSRTGEKPLTAKEKAELDFFLQFNSEVESLLKAKGYSGTGSGVPGKFTYVLPNPVPADLRDLMQLATDRALDKVSPGKKKMADHPIVPRPDDEF